MTSEGMAFYSWSAKKSCFNCNDWLTFRDERHTLAYESLRWLTTTKESTRIITHLNLLSRFEYLIMFSSSLFHIKRSRLYIKFIRYSLVKMRPQHAASIWHIKRSFSNKLSSTSSSDGNLACEDEPEYVESFEDQGWIPRDVPIGSIISSRLKKRLYNFPKIICNPQTIVR